MVGSTFRSSAVLREYLSESCRSLINLLVDLYGEDYWNTTQQLATVANQAYTAIPDDVFKVGYLRVTLDGERNRIPLGAIDDVDLEVAPFNGWSSSLWPSFRARGNRVIWTRTPTAVHSVTLDYVPNAIFADADGDPITDLTDDDDTFDGIFGWHKWAVVDAAIKARSDNGKDVSALLLELKDCTREVQRSASNRVATEPERVRDTWRRRQGGAPR